MEVPGATGKPDLDSGGAQGHGEVRPRQQRCPEPRALRSGRCSGEQLKELQPGRQMHLEGSQDAHRGAWWGGEGPEGTEAGCNMVLLGKPVGDEPRFLPRAPGVLVVWPGRPTSTAMPLFQAGPNPACRGRSAQLPRSGREGQPSLSSPLDASTGDGGWEGTRPTFTLRGP